MEEALSVKKWNWNFEIKNIRTAQSDPGEEEKAEIVAENAVRLSKWWYF